MFGWNKKKSAEQPPTPSAADESGASGEPGEPAIAALLMENAYPMAEFRNRLQTLSVLGRSLSNVSLDKGILTFNLGDELVAIAPMPAPYPWADLEGPCKTSWMWPAKTPATNVQKHRTHVLVTLIGGKSDAVARRIMLVQITAAAASVPGRDGDLLA
jgi:hypothetical protein